MQMLSVDQMLPQDHRVRSLWAFVSELDLEPFYRDIQVTDHVAGQPAIAPDVLVALWLQATVDGIGGARELDRRCKTDLVYLWLLGGVTVNYHTLSDCRVLQGEQLEALLVDVVAALVERGVVPLDTIAQDGMRVRAGAGSSSFRRKATLEQLQQAAQKHVEKLRAEVENDSDRREGDARRQAARERAAREKQERIAEALEQYKSLSRQREARKKGDGESTRVSTTDPDARKMKMANGGFDPAYNVQFASDASARVIVGVTVTNAGTDGGELPPMLEKINQSYGKQPNRALVDGAFATIESVTLAEAGGTQVISSIPRAGELRRNGKDPHARQGRDTDEYATFRKRMADPEFQELYKSRPSVAEFPNAECRNRNLRQFRVRGLMKVTAVALWHALAFNFLRVLDLQMHPA
jgi:transposase